MAAGTTTLDQAQTASTSSDLRSGVSPQVVLSGLNKHFNPRYISPEAEEAVEALKDHRHIDDFAPDEIEKAWSQFENFYHRFKRENNGKTPIPEEMFIQLKHTALHWHDLRDREKKFAWIQDWINSS